MNNARTLKAFFEDETAVFPDGAKINLKNKNWVACKWIGYKDGITGQKKGWVEGPAEEIGKLEAEYVRRSPHYKEYIKLNLL